MPQPSTLHARPAPGTRPAGARRTAALAVILGSYLMIVLDISVVITALPKMQHSLGFSTASLSWVQNSYTLVFGGLMTVVNFAVALMVPRLTRRYGNGNLLALGLTVTLIGMAWLSRLSPDGSYLTTIALPMVLIGAGQGATLSPLTAAGVTGVPDEEAGAAAGAVNVAHQLGGSLGLAVLVTVFAAAGSTSDSVRELFAHQVSVALAAGAVSLALALAVVLLTRPRGQGNLS